MSMFPLKANQAVQGCLGIQPKQIMFVNKYLLPKIWIMQ